MNSVCDGNGTAVAPIESPTGCSSTKTPLLNTTKYPPALIPGDNLAALQLLKAQGAKFDLVELDGPYMAGLEDWDTLTEQQYIDHYAQRLILVRDILQPWGVVFVFGYPEGCAEIKSWAHRTETLYLRRWLTWHKFFGIHKGRKIESICVYSRDFPRTRVGDFGAMLREMRQRKGWTLRQLAAFANDPWWHRGGSFYFETGDGDTPNAKELKTLAAILEFDPTPWWHLTVNTFRGLTDIDVVRCDELEPITELNASGLRSKPVQLYLDLFRPTIPPTETRRALILYGGSGNAGIAAGALGYDVTICESNPERCQLINGRWEKEVRRWTERARARQGVLPLLHPQQAVLL